MKSILSTNQYFTKIILFALFFILTRNCYSQHPNPTYRVFLKDKGPHRFEKGSPLYDSTIKLYTKRAIERRLKIRTEEELWTEEDAPVYEYYCETIKSLGAQVLLKLRWDNYIVVSCDSVILSSIKNLPFVKYIQHTSSKLKILSHNNEYQKAERKLSEILTNEFINCDNFDYGESFFQNSVINVIPLHSMGITGEDVIIGIIDTGFNTKIHKGLNRTNVLEEKDFIFNDNNVSNEVLDTTDQEGHGTIVLSTISAYYPGHLIGISPSSSFLLAKTEYLSSETHLEEDNYAAAVEWLESKGADIISSSLGYFYFDSTEEKYNYDELDGKTTIVARAINRAVARGVVCVTAAGNSGPNEKTINSPADADSVLAIAGVTETMTVPDFTSRGPRGDGKIKPDIASMGVQVVCTPPQWSDGTIKVNGTSLATPQIAGGIALILSIFPELAPYQIRNTLKTTASQSQTPDNKIGYGIANIYKAVLKNGIVISPMISYRMQQYQRLGFFIISESEKIDAWLNVKFYNKTDFDSYKLYKSSIENFYVADIPINLFTDSSAIGYIIANDWTLEKEKSSRRYPYKNYEYLTIKPNSTIIPCGVNQNSLPIIDDNKSNAYLFPSVLTNAFNQVTVNIPLNIESNINIDIFDNLGRKVCSYREENHSPGIVNIPINIQEFGSGAYFVLVKYNYTTELLKFIISR